MTWATPAVAYLRVRGFLLPTQTLLYSASLRAAPQGNDGALAGTFETEALRWEAPPAPQEEEVRDRAGAAVRVPRPAEGQAVPRARRDPEGPHPERGMGERHGPEDGRHEEGPDRDGERERVERALRHADHRHAVRRRRN